MLKKVSKYNRLNLILAISLLSIGLLFNYLSQNSILLDQSKNKIDVVINEFLEFSESIATNNNFNNIVTNPFATNALNNKDFTVLIYKNDSLLYWNKKAVFPIHNSNNFIVGENIVKLKDGFYYKVNRFKDVENIRHYIVTLLPLFYEFEIQNEYLKNYSNPLLELGDNIILSSNQKSENSFYNKKKEYLFSIEAKSKFIGFNNTFLGDTLILISFLFLLIYFTILGDILLKRNKNIVGSFVIIFPFLLFYFVVVVLKIPGYINNSFIFDTAFFRNSAVISSLGFLMVVTIIFVWLITILHFNLNFKTESKSKLLPRVGLYFICTALVFPLAVLVVAVCKEVIINSTFKFTLSNFLNFDFKLVLSIGCILFLILGLFVVYAILIKLNIRLGLKNLYRNIVFAVLFIITAILLYYNFDNSILIYSLILISIIWLSDQFSTLNTKNISSIQLVFLLISAAIFTSLVIFQLYDIREKQEREKYASTISLGRNAKTELDFYNTIKEIKQDKFVNQYFNSGTNAATSFISSQQLIDRIQQVYLSKFITNFTIEIKPYDNSNFTSKEVIDFKKEIKDKKEFTPYENIYLLTADENIYEYIADFDIDADKNNGMIVYMKPKSFIKTSLYDNLLFSIKNESQQLDYDYSYAIYEKENLSIKKGSFSFPQKFTGFFPNIKENTFIKKDLFSHYISNYDENKKLVLSKTSSTWFDLVTYFSFVFLLFVSLLLVLWLFRLFIRTFIYREKIVQYVVGTFKRRINFSMITMLLVSFILTGAVMIFYLLNKFESYDLSKLTKSQESILNNINLVNGKDFFDIKKQKDLSNFIESLADIYQIDINLYNSSGYLIQSSRPAVFQMGLQSNYINPDAYISLIKNNENRFDTEEKIGKLNYSSSYFPMYNKENNIDAILNVPYYAKSVDLRKDFSTFIMALLNVYTLLLIVGGFASVLLTESLTKSLSFLSEKIKAFTLGKTQEQLTWSYNDEIGNLVGQYNKMVSELEQSAILIAQSERQSGWRDMAQQVAHEIKNPLTPMKLQIQHLKRAVNDNRDDIQEIMDKVSNTLIEQIDNLAQIASEFSNFAKMPEANAEIFNLKNLVESSINLYDKTDDHIKVEQYLPKGDCMVYCDKNHIIRVLNNLLKNATQAIPDSRKKIIKVTLKPLKDKRIALLAVEDNGKGISEDAQKNIFVPKFTTKSSGMGLGLAMTKQIIENANGKIYFTTEVNRGTTFFVELPLEK